MKDLSGKKYGMLTVIERYNGHSKSGHTLWICKCDCGNTKVADRQRLISGQVKSCGCYLREFKRGNEKYDGLSNTRAYTAWLNIKKRCYDPKNKHYHNYGGRGISMCEEWHNENNGFLNFYNWSIKNGYKENVSGNECSIDRIDNDGNYEPSNCRWVTRIEQQNNLRNNFLVTCNGETHSISEWSRIRKIPRSTLYYRIINGWEISKALNIE